MSISILDIALLIKTIKIKAKRFIIYQTKGVEPNAYNVLKGNNMPINKINTR